MGASPARRHRRRRLIQERRQRVAQQAQARAREEEEQQTLREAEDRQRVLQEAEQRRQILQQQEAARATEQARREDICRRWKHRRAAKECASILSSDERVSVARARYGVVYFSTNWIFSLLQEGWYRIGRFDVMMPPNRTQLCIRCNATGKKNGTDPLYVFPMWPTPCFCFGSGERGSFLTALIESGEFLPAAYLMLDSFASINAGDQIRALEEYVRVDSPDPVTGGNDVESA